jgi:hypothetical protein
MSADVVPCRDCLSGHKDKFVSRPLMSQMGQKRKCPGSRGTSVLPSIATVSGVSGHVRFTPGSDRIADIAGGPVRANRGPKRLNFPS